MGLGILGSAHWLFRPSGGCNLGMRGGLDFSSSAVWSLPVESIASRRLFFFQLAVESGKQVVDSRLSVVPAMAKPHRFGECSKDRANTGRGRVAEWLKAPDSKLYSYLWTELDTAVLRCLKQIVYGANKPPKMDNSFLLWPCFPDKSMQQSMHLGRGLAGEF